MHQMIGNILYSALLAFSGTPDVTPMSAPVKPAQLMTTCISAPPYFLVTHETAESSSSESGKTIVLVKYTPQTECVYHPEKGDFKIKDVPFDSFIQVKRHYLFLGGGTWGHGIKGAGSEDFAVYNLKTRQKIYSNSYVSDDVNVKNASVYFTTYLASGDKNNCKDYNKVTEDDTYNAQLVVDVKFSLDDLEHPESLKLVRTSTPYCISSLKDR